MQTNKQSVLAPNVFNNSIVALKNIAQQRKTAVDSNLFDDKSVDDPILNQKQSMTQEKDLYDTVNFNSNDNYDDDDDDQSFMILREDDQQDQDQNFENRNPSSTSALNNVNSGEPVLLPVDSRDKKVRKRVRERAPVLIVKESLPTETENESLANAIKTDNMEKVPTKFNAEAAILNTVQSGDLHESNLSWKRLLNNEIFQRVVLSIVLWAVTVFLLVIVNPPFVQKDAYVFGNRKLLEQQPASFEKAFLIAGAAVFAFNLLPTAYKFAKRYNLLPYDPFV